MERGPFGKLHVRFGKAARTSGPRPRWVPMLDGLEVVLGWYLTDVRSRFPESAVLFCDESGGRLATCTVRNRLRHLMELEGQPSVDWFSPHALRRACATQFQMMPGITTKELMARIGHSSPRAALIYQHATAERDREVATFLEARFDAAKAASPRLVALPRASEEAAVSEPRGIFAGSGTARRSDSRTKKVR